MQTGHTADQNPAFDDRPPVEVYLPLAILMATSAVFEGKML